LSISFGSYQEDGHSICCLTLDPEELRANVKQTLNVDWDALKAGRDLAGQVVFVGIYDGQVIWAVHDYIGLTVTEIRHGGATVSDHLRRELHGLFETADKYHVPEIYDWVKSIGGYFRRYNGGVLAEWVTGDLSLTPPLDLESRATLAFLQV
jgi:protein phosphatase PTC6